jgi:putative ABC transport system permease protein
LVLLWLRWLILRFFFSLFCIVIGVSAVVSMAAAVEGLHNMVTKDLSQLGSGVFQVQRQPIGFDGPRQRAKYEKRKPFTMADVTLLQQQCRECLLVGGEAWEVGRVDGTDGKRVPGVAVVGGTPEFFENNGYAVGEGRLYDEGQAAAAAELIVLGSDVAEVLFPDGGAIGSPVIVKNRRLRVVGVLERRGSSLGGSIDKIAVIPLFAWQQIYGARRSLNVTIQARDPEKMLRAQDEVVAILRKARGVPPQAENDFELFSNASIQETFTKLSTTIATASIGICAIALLIGGIGVMNIMLVAVTERTSEIGVRRALGARRRRILGQFIVEAVVLCSLGGALGIGLGAFVAFLVKVLVGIETVIPAWAVMLSMFSSGGVGLVFGIYPAWRASRLDPVEAMRHE